MVAFFKRKKRYSQLIFRPDEWARRYLIEDGLMNRSGLRLNKFRRGEFSRLLNLLLHEHYNKRVGIERKKFLNAGIMVILSRKIDVLESERSKLNAKLLETEKRLEAEKLLQADIAVKLKHVNEVLKKNKNQ